MDYKEKFEDLLSRIQRLLDNAKKQGHIIVRVENLENTFPELVESEDEKIRKEILSLIHYTEGRRIGYRSRIDQNKMIDWLEKQGEQKPADLAKQYLVSKGYPVNTGGDIPTYEELYEIIKEGIMDVDKEKVVDLGLPSGTLWAKCNLGAEKETDFGLYYQWGDVKGYKSVGKHQFSWEDYKYCSWDDLTKYNGKDTKLILDNEDDPVFVATNGKFKMPTKEQMQELINNTNHKWINVDGINGMKFISKKDSTKYIFIPAAGSCNYGDHTDVGSWGCVWSASCSESYAFNAWIMAFYAGDVCMYSSNRYYGYSMRGVK